MARPSPSAHRWQLRWENPFSSRARRKRYKVRSARSARATERSRGWPKDLLLSQTECSWTLALVFAARVVGDLRWVGLFKRVKGTPFAWWDTWLYVPLAGLLALAALLVALNGS
ncbi:MAG TPA: DUF3995 domain-containing protein [Candidatus Binatus sp.]|nr:DUF3995 domain-containing protein [Candidatus Binatus sp.]